MSNKRENGSVLVVALIIALVMVGFGLAYLELTSTQAKQIMVSVDTQEAFQVSLAGFDMSRCYLLGKFNESSKSWDNELLGCVDNSNNTTPGDGVGLDETIYDNGTVTDTFEWATNFDYQGSTYLATITDNDDGGVSDTDDTDNMVILTVTATRATGITVSQALNQGIPASVVQALVKYKPPVYEPDCAIVTGGDLTLSGSSTITGTEGNVYATEDVTISGNASVEQDVFTAGTVTVDGTEYTTPDPSEGIYPGAPAPDVPKINPADYSYLANYILDTNGNVVSPTTGFIYGNALLGTVLGWDFNGVTWRCNDSNPANGTFYVPGGMDVDISGNPGSVDPWQVTLLVTGAVDISGTPVMTPDSEGVVIMAYGDVNITGNLTVQDGLVATHGQMSIKGSVDILGSVVAEAANLGVPGIDVTLSGNASITYNGGLTTFLDQGDEMVIIKGFKRIR